MSVTFHDRGAPELPKPVAAAPAPAPVEEPTPEPAPSSDPELDSWSELAPPSTRPETPAAKAATKP